jgi:hypothetical protein
LWMMILKLATEVSLPCFCRSSKDDIGLLAFLETRKHVPNWARTQAYFSCWDLLSAAYLRAFPLLCCAGEAYLVYEVVQDREQWLKKSVMLYFDGWWEGRSALVGGFDWFLDVFGLKLIMDWNLQWLVLACARSQQTCRLLMKILPGLLSSMTSSSAQSIFRGKTSYMFNA